MYWDVASIYPHNFTSSCSHIFCEVHQSLLQQSTPITWCCHPRAPRLGWCSLACKPPLFPPNITIAKQFYFVSSDQRRFLQKVRSLSPCAVANRSLAFIWRFWNSGFFLAEQSFRLCQYRTHFTVDIDTFVPVSSSAVVLGLICTFHTKVHTKGLNVRNCEKLSLNVFG